MTEIDTWAEDEVVSRIESIRPGDGFLGEEGTNRPSQTGITWVIDPIDGTTNLLYDLPGYSVSIAAAIDGASHAGAVFDPIRDEGNAYAEALRSAGVAVTHRCETSLTHSFTVFGGISKEARRAVDRVADDVDNCPDAVNADQADADGDGLGDVCDPDSGLIFLDGFESGDASAWSSFQ